MAEEKVDSPEMKVTNAAAAVAIKDGKVLLVEEGEGSSHVTGMLGIPSGRVDPGETEIEAAAREFREETGLTVTLEDLEEFPGNIFHADIPRKNGEIEKFNWHVFRVKNFTGDLLEEGDNVKPMWVEISELEKLQEEGRLHPNVLNAVNNALASNS